MIQERNCESKGTIGSRHCRNGAKCRRHNSKWLRTANYWATRPLATSLHHYCVLYRWTGLVTRWGKGCGWKALVIVGWARANCGSTTNDKQNGVEFILSGIINVRSSFRISQLLVTIFLIVSCKSWLSSIGLFRWDWMMKMHQLSFP